MDHPATLTNPQNLSDFQQLENWLKNPDFPRGTDKGEAFLLWKGVLKQAAENPRWQEMPTSYLYAFFHTVGYKLEKGKDDPEIYRALKKIYVTSGCRLTDPYEDILSSYCEKNDLFDDILDLAAANANSSSPKDPDVLGYFIFDCFSNWKTHIAGSEKIFDKTLEFFDKLPPKVSEDKDFSSYMLKIISHIYALCPQKIKNWEALNKLAAADADYPDYEMLKQFCSKMYFERREDGGKVLGLIRRQALAAKIRQDSKFADISYDDFLKKTDRAALTAELNVAVRQTAAPISECYARFVLDLINNGTPDSLFQLEILENINANCASPLPLAMLFPQQLIAVAEYAADSKNRELADRCFRLMQAQSGKINNLQGQNAAVIFRFYEELTASKNPDLNKDKIIDEAIALFRDSENYQDSLPAIRNIIVRNRGETVFLNLLAEKTSCIQNAGQQSALLKILAVDMQKSKRIDTYPQIIDLLAQTLSTPHKNSQYNEMSQFALTLASKAPQFLGLYFETVGKTIKQAGSPAQSAYIKTLNRLADHKIPRQYLQAISRLDQINSNERSIFSRLRRQTDLEPQSARPALDFINRNLQIEKKMGEPEFLEYDLEANAGILKDWQQILLNLPQHDAADIKKYLQLNCFNAILADTVYFDPNLWKEAGETANAAYAKFTPKQQRKLHYLFENTLLSDDEKKLWIAEAFTDIDRVNIPAYLKIKDYLAEYEFSRLQITDKTQWHSDNDAWLIPSAVACACLYGKDFMQYFRTIENYNRSLPKWQAEMPAKEKLYRRKAEFITAQYLGSRIILNSLNRMPSNVALVAAALKKNMFLHKGALSPESLKVIRQWQDEIQHMPHFNAAREYQKQKLIAQSRLGSLFGIVNYIDYNALSPVGAEQATAWMLTAAKDDANRIRSYFDLHLKASNAAGQPFLRICAAHFPSVRLKGLEDARQRVEASYGDDYKILAGKLKYISDNDLCALKYGDVYDRLSQIQFNGRSLEFSSFNAQYLSSQEQYEKAENIYFEGALTPSRFADKPIVYNPDQTFRCRVAPKNDPRILFVGHYTSCCQSFDDSGAACAIDSVVNPHSGCLLFEKKTNGDWKICGCSWFYESQKGAYKVLTFDNVEVTNYIANQKAVRQLLEQMVKEFAKDNYRSITIGNSDDLNLDGCPRAPYNHPRPQGYPASGYSDAKSQRLLYDNPQATPETVQSLVTYSCNIFKTQIMANDQDFAEAASLERKFGSRYLRIKDGNRLCGLAVWNNIRKQAVVAVDSEYAAEHPAPIRAFSDFALKCIVLQKGGEEWATTLAPECLARTTADDTTAPFKAFLASGHLRE